MILKLWVFVHFDEAFIKAAWCEASYQKLLFLGGMDDYIRPISVPKR